MAKGVLLPSRCLATEYLEHLRAIEMVIFIVIVNFFSCLSFLAELLSFTDSANRLVVKFGAQLLLRSVAMLQAALSEL